MMKNRRLKSGRKTLDVERQLVALCVAGDNDAWERLIDDYGPFIYSVIARGKPEPQQAREIFLYVLEGLWRDGARRLAAWEGRSRLSTYICALASRLCADYYRSRHFKEGRRHVALDSVGPEGYSDCRVETAAGPVFEGPRRRAFRTEGEAVIGELLSRLPDRGRAILKLFYWQGRRYSEIAALLEISVSEVGKSLCRVRKELRGLLAARGIKKYADLWE